MIEADSQTNLTGGNDLKICDLKQEIIQNDERVELIEEDLSNDFKSGTWVFNEHACNGLL